jgi:hypothetical protein
MARKTPASIAGCVSEERLFDFSRALLLQYPHLLLANRGNSSSHPVAKGASTEMRRILPMVFVFSMLLGHPSTRAMGEKKPVPSRQEKVTYAEVVRDHPQVKEMVEENGFNSLNGKEQWELIGMVDRYTFFRQEGEYYAGESPAQSMIYLNKAKSIKKEMRARFGHVLKK